MEVKQRIIEGAGNLFFSRGIRRVTMDDLAGELGMSKRTIYEHFSDKTELLLAMQGHFQQEHERYMRELLNSSEHVMEVIIAILRYGLEAINKINPLYLEDLRKFYPEIWEENIKKGRESNQQQMRELLERGKKEGLFRPDINSKLVARIFYEHINLMHSDEAFPKDEFPRKELFENMFLNFARGISTFKGMEVLEELLKNED
ncbi:MAG: TetR/AcrR family transcriptional regulator [Marinilabiliaceae bacterium]